MLRTLTEKLARGVVFRRRLPQTFGRRPFYVTPDAALAYLKPGYGEFCDLFRVASDHIREGDTVWNIGANVGLFSALAAHQAGSQHTDSVTALPRDSGYHLFDGQHPVADQRPGLRATFNTLAIPAERAEELPVRQAA